LQNLLTNKLLIGGLLALCLALSAMLWRRPPEEDKAAMIDGAVITGQQLEASLGRQLSQLNQQIYNLKRQKLDQLVDAQLLTEEAKRRGISVESLLDREINDKVVTVSEEEIRTFYESNKDRLRMDLDKIHDQVRDYLNQQRQQSRRNEYFKALRAKAKITTYLEPPPLSRASVSINGAPVRGPERAKVTIVKFEDFQCPFCKSAQPTLAVLLKKYESKVRLVHKDLPLEEIHPQAELAAEAARCAGDQGKFWQYHDTLYTNAPKLSPDDLKGYAKEVGLDPVSFDQCLASGKHKNGVAQDRAEGVKLGLTGTPSFFINGREFSGAQPLEAFSAIVDDELARAK
jgi:protein-disulfide isomerase